MLLQKKNYSRDTRDIHLKKIHKNQRVLCVASYNMKIFNNQRRMTVSKKNVSNQSLSPHIIFGNK